MRQAVLTAPFTVDLREVPVPAIRNDQVLLRVTHVGVCASDMQIYHGLHPYMTYPVTPGHEVAGVIEAVGRDAAGYRVGQRVTLQPQVFCGECYPCSIGRFNVCESLKVMGVHTDGFAAAFAAVEPRNLHPCPDDLPLEQIALAEPLAVGVGAVRRGRCRDANVAVIGAGTIGNLTAQAARTLGAGQVLIVDVLDSRLEYARQCGIRHCANTGGRSLREAVAQAFGKRGADVIIDCAATEGSFLAALAASRPSSEIVITGNFKAPVALDLPAIQRREISLVGHMMYVREDLADAIRLLKSGAVHTGGLVTQRYPLERIGDAFAFIDKHPGDVMKCLIQL